METVDDIADEFLKQIQDIRGELEALRRWCERHNVPDKIKPEKGAA